MEVFSSASPFLHTSLSGIIEHLVVILLAEGLQIGLSRTVNELIFYTCDECGGDTWKPTYPLAVNLVSILLVGFLLWITMYALWDLDKDLRRLLFPFVTFYVAFLLYKNSRKNSAHWREFDAWAKSKRKSLKKQ